MPSTSVLNEIMEDALLNSLLAVNSKSGISVENEISPFELDVVVVQ